LHGPHLEERRRRVSKDGRGHDLACGRPSRRRFAPRQDETGAGALEKVVDLHKSGRANRADTIWAFVLLGRNVRSMRAIA
jgi:hypothetical protein